MISESGDSVHLILYFDSETTNCGLFIYHNALIVSS